MLNVLLVGVGGALGAIARYGVVLLVRPRVESFPAGTLACNLIGCAVIGLLAGWMSRWSPAPDAADPWRLFLFVGVLGGFTTFSSLGLEVAEMMRGGRLGTAMVYVALSAVLGPALALGGYALTAR